MAVQAQHHSLGDQKNRTTQLSGLDFSNIDPQALLAPVPYHGTILTDRPPQQQPIFMGGSTLDGMQMLSRHAVTSPLPIQGLVLPNFSLYQGPPPMALADTDAATGGSRKRRKESHLFHQPQKHQLQLGVDLNQTLGCPPTTASPNPAVHNVSTGLRLAFDDERSTVTSARPDSNSSQSLTLKDELCAQLSQHQDELNQLIRVQAEQMRQALEERTQRQSKALLGAIEASLSKKLREKEVEMERMTRRNSELEDIVKQLSMESQMWQSKAKSNEAMVAILRTNLQQAVIVQHQSREQHSRLEGCGDSEVDDAASVYIDDNPHAQQCRAMAGLTKVPQFSHSSSMIKATQSSMNLNNEVSIMRACRSCRVKEASVVLLPCLHLCLCVTCKDECDRCPVCSTLRSASVEVYLS